MNAMSDPLVTAIETALSDTVAWRRPAYMSDTVQSLVAAGEYRKAAEVMAPRIRSLVDVGPDPALLDRLMELWREPWSEPAYGEAQMLLSRLRAAFRGTSATEGEPR